MRASIYYFIRLSPPTFGRLATRCILKQLRIIFTCLCALCLVAIFPIGLWLGLEAVIACVVVGGACFFLMLLCKQAQEEREEKRNMEILKKMREEEALGEDTPADTTTEE